MNFSLAISHADQLCLRLLKWGMTQHALTEMEANALSQEALPHLPALSRRYLESLLYLATGCRAVDQRLYDRFHQAQLTEITKLMGALEAAGCTALLWKGAELVPRGFGGHSLSTAKDFDVIVPRHQLATALPVITECGFRTGSVVDVTKPVLRPKPPIDLSSFPYDSKYALEPLCKFVEVSVPSDEIEVLKQLSAPRMIWPEGCIVDPTMVGRGIGTLYGKCWVGEHQRVKALIECDLHFRISHMYAPDALFERAQRSCLGVGQTLCDGDHLWVSLFKWYTQAQRFGSRRLRALASVAACIPKWNFDWDFVIAAGDDLGVRPCLYYPLAFLSMIHGGDLVPREVLDALDPAKLSPEERWFDFGWQLDKVLGGRMVLEPIAGR